MYEVIFYKDSQGKEPIKEYLDELKQKSLTSKNDRIFFFYWKGADDYEENR